MPKNFGSHTHTLNTCEPEGIVTWVQKKTLAIKYHGNCLGFWTVIDDCKQYFSVLHVDFIEWAQNVKSLVYIEMRCMPMRMHVRTHAVKACVKFKTTTNFAID